MIAQFVKGSLITSFPMADSMWATLKMFVKGSLMRSFLLTTSLWVMLHILWEQSHHIFPYPIACGWHCTFCGRQSCHIFSYDQQEVSDIIGHFVKGSLITSFAMTNSRKWVTLHILWKAASSHLFLCQPTGSESDSTHFVKGSIITSMVPMTNRKWVQLHIFWKAVSSHLFLWPTGSEWYCTFCERQSHHVFSCDQLEQQVSDIQLAHLVKDSLTTSFPVTNRLWVT